ncbi:xanthine dehydrogenase family protein molybdopterin-binding subunit [Pseudomonas lactis]|uniref:xanthine dehydrogenase family protein molybdopterin-binding subunit n=1 Tax=Pseudomonas lactis TaxID=1615674 RepID=UPI00110C8425|nr:molybdopterin cofactor-binding domain-containing protein [Pseudomonas lactis]
MIRSIQNESRRRFLQGTAGLTLAVYLPWSLAEGTARAGKEGTFEPNAFLRIGEDNVVTVISKHLEMGQGAYTGLATLVAEELDADWAQVRVESAPAESRYNNSLLGIQGTGGSSSIANSWEQLRKAGATARAMLVSAAAWLWKVPAQDIEVVDGVLRHAASGKQATFGQLAKLASEQPVPAEVKLKDPSAFKLIGRQQLARKDSADKVNGKAIYTQDIHLPGMLTAVVAHPPRIGAKVKSFDAKAALAIPGVVHVVQIPSGVAVVAKDTWSAKKGRDAVTIQWDESGAFKQSSEQLFQRYRELAKTEGTVVRNDGDVNTGLASATRTLEAEYDFPFLAHSAMEPMNCVVALTKYGCETWHGAQMQSQVQSVLAELFGLEPEQVRVHTLYAGGSFGRRASKDADYVLENAHIVKAIGGKSPVKLVWLREDDMQAGHYRPMYHHRLTAGLDDQGKLVAWQHRLVGQSVFAGSPFAAFIKDGIDSTSVEGGSTLPYRIPNLRVDLHTPRETLKKTF